MRRRSGPQPGVSVIVPARNAATTLCRALEALSEQEIEIEYEVIVVDDGSSDETAAVAARFEPLVSLIRNEQTKGPGAARNRAVSVARATKLAFTDADCVPTRAWLAAGLEVLDTADLVQGRVLPDPSCPRTPFDRSLRVEGDAGFYQTANLFLRRDAYEAVGGFRDWTLERRMRGHRAKRGRQVTARTAVGEDAQFGWSARRLGYRSAFAADALVHHAVVPGTVRDAIADRWHWTRDMPGLVRLVPELRETVLYHRWFFADWSAQFDLAATGFALALLTRRSPWLVVTLPYARRVVRETRPYRDGRDSRWGGLRRAARYVSGAPALDLATLVGFACGSLAWRCPVF